MSKQYYEANKEKIKKQNSDYRKAHPEDCKKWARESYHRRKSFHTKKFLLKYAKARATKKNIPFNIVEDDIIIPDKCPIFNKEFILSDPKYSPSIDRIIPELGYIKGNIQIISSLANKMKWDSTQEELTTFCKGMLQFLDGGD